MNPTLRSVLTLAMDAVSRWLPRGGSASRGGVLVVKLDAIGDFVLWSSCAHQLRRLYPSQRIVLLANAAWAPIAGHLPYWDDVLPVDVRRLTVDVRYRLGMIRRIRAQRFDIAMQPTFSRHFLTGDPMVRASGAPQRIGSFGDLSILQPWEKRIADRWYTQLLPVEMNGRTELELHADFVSQLAGQALPPALPHLPPLGVPRPPATPAQPYFIVFPGASWTGRQWPVASFIETVSGIHASTGWLPVLCGSAGERGLCEAIASGSAMATLNLAGQTSMPDFVELTRSAAFLLGNDTSGVHVAAAVGTPSICILGGGHFGRFHPYPSRIGGAIPVVAHHPMPCFNCNWHCTQPHAPNGAVPCVSGVSAASVLAQFHGMLPTCA